MKELVYIATDWWSVGATILAGVLTAITTMAAVIYTNYRTKEQLKQQEIKFENERKEQLKQSKYVVIKPTLMLTSFMGVLEQLIVRNDFNRMLLFSGDDGFDFFDDTSKRSSQQCRMLLIENKSDCDIRGISVNTKSVLSNLNTEERMIYKTNNAASFLRGNESIIVRLANQGQYKKILELNKEKVPSSLDFYCKIEYSTLANQRISYVYKININNDHRIEIEKDEVESVVDLENSTCITPTIFRNLQDSIAGVDRAEYSWEKMGQAQMRGIMAQYNPSIVQQNVNTVDPSIVESVKKSD